MALEPKNKNVILNILILLLAVFIAFNFVYKKQEQELQGLMAQKDTEIKKNAVLQNIGRIERRIADYKAMLPQRDPSEAINAVNDIARACDVKIVSIRPAVSEEKAGYVISGFEASLSAPSYHALGRFISSLENYQDIYIIDSVDITGGEPGKELTARLTVSTIAVQEQK